MMRYAVQSNLELGAMVKGKKHLRYRQDYNTMNYAFAPEQAARWTSYLVAANYMNEHQEYDLVSMRIPAGRLCEKDENSKDKGIYTFGLFNRRGLEILLTAPRDYRAPMSSMDLQTSLAWRIELSRWSIDNSVPWLLTACPTNYTSPTDALSCVFGNVVPARELTQGPWAYALTYGGKKALAAWRAVDCNLYYNVQTEVLLQAYRDPDESHYTIFVEQWEESYAPK